MSERRIVKVLVTAASKYGSTAEIARRIGGVLAARGHDPNLGPPDDVDVATYDAVVLGSGVYAGHWLPAAKAGGHRVFAGKIDRSKLTFPEKAIVVALRVRSGDFRDWNEIEEWAGQIADALGSGAGR